MNSKILEYAYEMIHKLEVKNIAHKDKIAELEKALVKVELFLEVTASPVFILAEHDYPLSIGPKSNSIELEIIKSTVSKAKGGAE